MSGTGSTNGQPIGSGAAPSLAAHSKDASTPGQNPAAAATGNAHQPVGGTASSDTVARLSGQAREAASQVAGKASRVYHQARDRLPEDASEQVMEFVRERPVTAMLGAGVVGVALGILLSRR